MDGEKATLEFARTDASLRLARQCGFWISGTVLAFGALAGGALIRTLAAVPIVPQYLTFLAFLTFYAAFLGILLGWASFHFARKERLLLNENGVVWKNGFNKVFVMPWANIAVIKEYRVRTSKPFAVKLTDKMGGSVRLTDLEGLAEVLQAIRQNTVVVPSSSVVPFRWNSTIGFAVIASLFVLSLLVLMTGLRILI